jgi:hypothetical protein
MLYRLSAINPFYNKQNKKKIKVKQRDYYVFKTSYYYLLVNEKLRINIRVYLADIRTIKYILQAD